MRKIQITEEQREELETARKANKNKQAENRLRAVLLRAEGKSNAEVGEICEYDSNYVSQLVSKYCKGGLYALIGNHYAGNRRNMSFAEEANFLQAYKDHAERGQLVEISMMKKAYEEKVGHAIGSAQIYRVLHRHGWRKVMPRSKHPKKANQETIEVSKKLTMQSGWDWKILQQEESD